MNEIEFNLKQALANAAKAAFDAEVVASNVVIEIPKDKNHGDYSSNIAMQLTRVLRNNPRVIAQGLIDHLDKEAASIESVEIAGPGFLNFKMSNASLTSVIDKVLSQGDNYGKNDSGAGKKVNVEYVSANPTGDLHLGHARGAAWGDSITRLMNFSGYDVTREYYVNDAGVQILKLSQSIFARYQQELGLDVKFPEDGYHGPDIIKFANSLKEQYGNTLLEKPLSYFREIGIEHELNKIRKDLDYFRVNFNVYSHEVMLYEKGWVEQVIPALREKGYIRFEPKILMGENEEVIPGFQPAGSFTPGQAAHRRLPPGN